VPATRFPSAYQPPNSTSPSAPDRSPLEPLGSYQRRMKKFSRDQAWRAGQMQAIEELDKARTPTIPSVAPGKNQR
jgi:hypothetical protein